MKFLIGNKSDLETSRQVKTEEGKTLADSLGIRFLETSAKEAINVEKAFTILSNEIKSKVQSRPGQGLAINKKPSDATVLNPKIVDKSNRSGCCWVR